MNPDRLRPRLHIRPPRATLWYGLPLLAALAALPSQAQYKVVGPDGKVTYTDRQPTAAEGRVSSLGARSAPPSNEPALPFELRQPVARYPVTLYVTSGNCEPCESARQLLRQRGVPFTEKQLLNAEDSDALERLSGGRDVPTLSIGSQNLRGLAATVWGSYLDAAGYPRESRLPTNFQNTPPSPLTERREAAVRPAAPRASQPEAAPTPVAPPPGSIRF